jgi:hypothetical protein
MKHGLGVEIEKLAQALNYAQQRWGRPTCGGSEDLEGCVYVCAIAPCDVTTATISALLATSREAMCVRKLARDSGANWLAIKMSSLAEALLRNAWFNIAISLGRLSRG